MALENGLKPSLLGFKGIGYNRALPESFEFKNGFLGDGVNDYFTIPEAIGESTIEFLTKEYSIFVWVKLTGPLDFQRGLFSIAYIGTQRTFLRGGSPASRISYNILGPDYNVVTLSNDEIFMWGLSLNYNLNRYFGYKNELLNVTGLAGTMINENNPITNIFIGQENGIFFNDKVDEFKIYTREVLLDESRLLYNNGNGSNPSNTIGLKLWYDFNKAEIATDLYPNTLPIGWNSTDWGIRNKAAQDSWIKKYHAKAVNMTNNDTLGGALTSW